MFQLQSFKLSWKLILHMNSLRHQLWLSESEIYNSLQKRLINLNSSVEWDKSANRSHMNETNKLAIERTILD